MSTLIFPFFLSTFLFLYLSLSSLLSRSYEAKRAHFAGFYDSRSRSIKHFTRDCTTNVELVLEKNLKRGSSYGDRGPSSRGVNFVPTRRTEQPLQPRPDLVIPFAKESSIDHTREPRRETRTNRDAGRYRETNGNPHQLCRSRRGSRLALRTICDRVQKDVCARVCVCVYASVREKVYGDLEYDGVLAWLQKTMRQNSRTRSSCRVPNTLGARVLANRACFRVETASPRRPDAQ